jgi:hypothetical protein
VKKTDTSAAYYEVVESESEVVRLIFNAYTRQGFSLGAIDCIAVGVDRMQRNFEPIRKQVEAWQRSEFTDVTAKVVIYEAFVEGKLEAPKHLARAVHDLIEIALLSEAGHICPNAYG